jgi:perosamine synthetase
MRIPVAQPAIDARDVEAVSAAVASGWISGRGLLVKAFEDEFGAWLNVRNVISCSSGTSALHLALASIGVKAGDEVIIPAFSMGAIAFAVRYTGARIVLADSELSTWNIDPEQVEKRITSKTKAIIAMHTYGHPAHLDPIVRLCRDRGILLIEDAAEAHGAEYRGKRVGTIGDIGCFSFFANKIITTGEGGAMVTSDGRIADAAKSLRDMAFSQDLSRKFLHEQIGFNYRLTNMQAALGSAQLKRIEEFIAKRRKNAALYNSLLSKVDGIITPPEANWAKNVYWMYSILVAPNYGLTRDELMSSLSLRGIETRPFFVPIHQQPVFAEDHVNEDYPSAVRLSQCGLNLPSGNTMTEEQVEFVASTIGSLKHK